VGGQAGHDVAPASSKLPAGASIRISLLRLIFASSARITRRSAEKLAIRPGLALRAQIKAVALLG